MPQLGRHLVRGEQGGHERDRLRGARTAWLQVEESNAHARGLYDSLGFAELYRYHYRQPPEAA